MTRTATIALTDFLLARIAEDEAAARDKGADAMIGHRWKHAPENVYQELQGEVLLNSRRVLAECGAKRRMVREATAQLAGRDIQGALSDGDGGPWMANRLLLALASVYAEHPDYDSSWA